MWFGLKLLNYLYSSVWCSFNFLLEPNYE